jgi:hypothetical protein
MRRKEGHYVDVRAALNCYNPVLFVTSGAPPPPALPAASDRTSVLSSCVLLSPCRCRCRLLLGAGSRTGTGCWCWQLAAAEVVWCVVARRPHPRHKVTSPNSTSGGGWGCLLSASADWRVAGLHSDFSADLKLCQLRIRSRVKGHSRHDQRTHPPQVLPHCF